MHVWHLDANLKLVRWGFYIHGIIDGYSGAVLSLLVSDENKAVTVFEGFHRVASLTGLPKWYGTFLLAVSVLATAKMIPTLRCAASARTKGRKIA
jgi:hypothetical protein